MKIFNVIFTRVQEILEKKGYDKCITWTYNCLQNSSALIRKRTQKQILKQIQYMLEIKAFKVQYVIIFHQIFSISQVNLWNNNENTHDTLWIQNNRQCVSQTVDTSQNKEFTEQYIFLNSLQCYESHFKNPYTLYLI